MFWSLFWLCPIIAIFIAMLTVLPSSSKLRLSFFGAPSRLATYWSVTTTFWSLLMVISISGFVGRSWPFMVTFMLWSVSSALFTNVLVTLDPSEGENRTRSAGRWEPRSAGTRSATGRINRLACMGFAHLSRDGGSGVSLRWIGGPGSFDARVETRHSIGKALGPDEGLSQGRNRPGSPLRREACPTCETGRGETGSDEIGSEELGPGGIGRDETGLYEGGCSEIRRLEIGRFWAGRSEIGRCTIGFRART